MIPNFTLSASASSTAICSGQTTTLTGIGANTYTWSPGALTGADFAVSPTVTTTYTVTELMATAPAQKQLPSMYQLCQALLLRLAQRLFCAGSSSTLTATGA